LNTNFNKDAKPSLMPGTTDRTMFMFTNDGVLALLAINVDHVSRRQADGQLTMAT